MSMMDPDVEFFGVQIKKGEEVGMQDYLESEEASYSSLHITQVGRPAPGAQHCRMFLYNASANFQPYACRCRTICSVPAGRPGRPQAGACGCRKLAPGDKPSARRRAARAALPGLPGGRQGPDMSRRVRRRRWRWAKSRRRARTPCLRRRARAALRLARWRRAAWNTSR
jgi:hypothetical protein